MSTTPRSMAVELALLFLHGLEPQVAQDPERLVATEAVLSFAAVKSADAPTWQRWRSILAQYDKLDLIEHMLGAPVPIDASTRLSAADRLIGLVLESPIELFHDPDQHGWAAIRVDGHWENHPIRSRPFQLFLLRTYYRETGCSPGVQAIHATQELLEAKALFDGPEALIHLRVANYHDKFYLDLCDRAWRAVEIDTEGWRVVERPPPRFHRTRGSQPLPAPERGGILDELRRFLNVNQQGWVLITWKIVAGLMAGRKSVYAESSDDFCFVPDRSCYNFAPAWAWIVFGLDRLSSLLHGQTIVAFRFALTAFLATTDVLIALVLAYGYSYTAALVFLLAPLFLWIEAYEGPFNNLALLVALLAWFLIRKKEPTSQAVFLSAELTGLSLVIKHILALFPLWLLFYRPLGKLRARLAYAFIAYGIFFCSFLPWWGDPGRVQGSSREYFAITGITATLWLGELLSISCQ